MKLGRHRDQLPLGPASVNAAELDLWVVSHGGVGSNALVSYLAGQGLRVIPENYGLICHRQHPGVPVGVPILVIYGDYRNAILSMARRGYLTGNASKMHFGIGAAEIPLRRFLNSYPEDPVGIKVFLDSFQRAARTRLDSVAFLEYPFAAETAAAALYDLGLKTSCSGLGCRARHRRPRWIPGDVRRVLEVYENWTFTPPGSGAEFESQSH